MVRKLSRGQLPKPLALVVSAVLALFWVAVAPVGVAGAAVVGGFEIEGNQVTESALDWQTAVTAPAVRDGVGSTDPTGFVNGDHESDAYPTSWGLDGGEASGKSDIGNVLVHDARDGGDTWAYLGFDRGGGSTGGGGDTGTVNYVVELNQAVNRDVVNPQRTDGDVRIVISDKGNQGLSVSAVEKWSGISTKWVPPTSTGSISVAVNSQDITDYFSSGNANPAGTLRANTFVELAVNLSDYGLTTCPVTGFSTINLRSFEGGGGTLKDLASGPIDIESDCSGIEIVKTVSGDGSGEGAVFMVEPDPTPGSAEEFLVVTTGEGGSVLVSPAFPGEYTVTELAPPSGYLLPAQASQTVEAPARGTGEVAFNDVLGDVTFTKGYEGDDPAVGASFRLIRTREWAYDTDPTDGIDAPVLVTLADGRTVDVTDNGSGDGNGAIGVVAVGGLQGGSWCITETAAPTGWVPADPDAEVCFDLGPTDSAEQVSVSLNPEGTPTFDNLLRTVDLQVEKTGSIPGVDGTFPLAGAAFSLFLDDGDGVWEPGQDVDDRGSLVTDAAGIATWTGLDWQQQYWLLERAAPSGYSIGLSPNPTPVGFTAPTTDDVVVTMPVDNPRQEFDVELEKVDAVDGTPLSGGGFQLWRETNGVDGLQTGGDTPDLNVNGTVPLDGGTLRFSAAEHHIPWGYTYYLYEATPPTGYGYMSPNPIEIDGTSPQVAGTAVTVEAEDPRQPAGLRIVKQDDFGAPVQGAVFRLYLSDGDETFEPGQDVLVGGEAVSGADGIAEWSGLTWGEEYYVYEVSAPDGYELMSPNPYGPIEVPKSAAGGVHEVTEPLVDPRTRGGFTITKQMLQLPDDERPVFTVEIDCGEGYFQGSKQLVWPTWTASVTGVPVGETCTVTEPTVPAGWERVSVSPSTVTIVEAPAQQVDVTVTNRRLYDTFDLKKVIEGTQIEGEDADFTVFVDCASADSKGNDYDQYVRLTTPKLTGTTAPVPVGLECTFTETGWDTSRYEPVSVEPAKAVSGDGSVGTITVTNERRQGTLTVAKEVERQTPEDAADTFPITVACANGYSETFQLADGQSAQTDAQPLGLTCTVTEGAIDTARYKRVSSAEQTGTVGQAQPVTVVNERLFGKVTVEKDPRGLLAGERASFTVRLDCQGERHDRTLTLDNGNAFSGTTGWLPAGVACTVSEPRVPDGWTLVGVDYPGGGDEVVVTAGQTVTVTVENRRQQGALEVLKLDDAENPLAGAQFTLWRSDDGVLDDGDTEVGTYTTGTAGTARATGLDWGFSYFWEETRAPAGYNLPTETVKGPVQLTAAASGDDLPVTTFVDLQTELTTTPYVDGRAVTPETLGTNMARVDENDVVRDKAVLRNLSEPAAGTVSFALYGPFTDKLLDGMVYEDVVCTDETLVLVSEERPISRVAEGTYEAWSEEVPVGDEGLEPGLYQWVATFHATDDKNVGTEGECGDETEQFVVRAGDAPGLVKESTPVSGSLVQPGQVIEYVVGVSNSGDMPIPAEEAVIVDELDPWLTYLGTTSAPEGTVETVSRDDESGVTTITWRIGALAAGRAVAVEYRAAVSGAVPQNEALDNEVTFLTEVDSTVHVVPNGALTVVKQVDPASGVGVVAGETLTYTLRVTATGELRQRDVLVVDNVPGTDVNHRESMRTTYVAGSARCGEAGDCDVTEPGTDGAIVWSLGDLAAGQSRTVTFQVTVDPVTVSGSGTVRVGDVLNSGWASSVDTDWTPSNVVVNPVAVVLGTRIEKKPQPTPEVNVLGTKLPRTGAPLGAGVWLAGAMLAMGFGLRVAARRERGQS
ncbi:MAG: SpaA isopeptide-forming pilin-related protein [Actinomycetota bacterium]